MDPLLLILILLIPAFILLANLGPRREKRILVNFTFPEGVHEKYRSALLPFAPRVGDQIKSLKPGGGIYVVKAVAFELDDFTSARDPRISTVEVELTALDGISGP